MQPLARKPSPMDADALLSEAPAAPVPATAVEPSDVRGLIDNATADRLYGWAWDAAHPGYRVKVEHFSESGIRAESRNELGVITRSHGHFASHIARDRSEWRGPRNKVGIIATGYVGSAGSFRPPKRPGTWSRPGRGLGAPDPSP